MLTDRRGNMQTHTFTLDQISSPLGSMLVVTDARGSLRALDWEDYEARLLRLLRLQYVGCSVELVGGAAPRGVSVALAAYFAGEWAGLAALTVETGGTAFQREVWAALRAIPAGQTLSYGALARLLGRSGGARAVGLANGANPIGIVVPCHRVIGANASLTGYGGGMHRKQWLLEHEGVVLPHGALPSRPPTPSLPHGARLAR
jgi:methylated-DNA-[protein]-cysteine S-methyltransferase